ncbi:MAG: beta-lactamase family protein [Treponema sp.]|nr:beta-lactamase family protein [Treponema sp.]
MKNKILLTILVILTMQFAAAMETPSGVPLVELEQFIDGFAAERIGVKTAGTAIAVVKNGEVVFNKSYGYAVQGETETSIDSVFEWGSATKLLVWTSVMQLVEQGKINLNTDIREYLPNNFLRKIKYDTPITMYNLMHHNAGWEDVVFNLFYSSPKIVPSLERSLLQENEPRQVFRPGTIVSYSNYGTALAGYIVELISGLPFYEYVWENIFRPLNINDTSVHPLQADNPSVAERRTLIKGHVLSGNTLVPSPAERIYIGLYPAGSAIGTASDAVKFLSALMPAENETSKLFNNNETLSTMLSVTLSFSNGFPRFSHGFMEHYSSVRALGHGGNTAAFSSLFTIAPNERFALVVLTNQAGESSMCFGLTNALFGEYEPSLLTEDFPDVSQFAGTYTFVRKPQTGFTRLPMSMTFLPLKTTEEEHILDVSGAKFVQIHPYMLKNTGGLDALDIIEYVFFETSYYTEMSKVSRASILYFDLHQVNTGYFITIIGSVILFNLCILFSVIALFIMVIGFIKNRKKQIPYNIMKKLNIILCSSMAAVTINNIILAGRALSFANYASLLVHFIINIIFMISVPVCISFIIRNWKNEPSKKYKVFCIIAMVFSLIYAVLLLTWEFWR